MINPFADPPIENSLHVLQRLYEQHPALVQAMVRVLDDPPEVGEVVLRFRGKRLSGIEMRESWY